MSQISILLLEDSREKIEMQVVTSVVYLVDLRICVNQLIVLRRDSLANCNCASFYQFIFDEQA